MHGVGIERKPDSGANSVDVCQRIRICKVPGEAGKRNNPDIRRKRVFGLGHALFDPGYSTKSARASAASFSFWKEGCELEGGVFQGGKTRGCVRGVY